ncbi:TraG [Palleronia caenipelagi]|uniref:TraG n=1 Tax=Palleronia caenipelagi TaxID=2489174 RepID=A0A547PKC2_9RHOB|nr:TraG [Palleronia caenipelagi]
MSRRPRPNAGILIGCGRWLKSHDALNEALSGQAGAVHSLIPASICFFLAWAVFALVGRSLKKEEFIRGARLVSKKELKRWVREKWRAHEKRFGKGAKKAPRYTLAGIELAPNAVEAQVGILGTVGVGKTTAMHELLKTVSDLKGRGIIYDRTGHLVSKHYVEGRDIILNPFDARSRSWNPFVEVTNPASFTEIAEVMIPQNPNEKDPFWTNAARLVFIYAARAIYTQENPNNAALRRAILEISNETLSDIVANTPGAHFFGDKMDRMSGSIRATLITHLSFLEYVRDDADVFSIREWVLSEDPGFVFLTTDAEHSAATRNVISTVIEIAANALMTMSESRDPRIWFFIDELPTLNRLPFLTGSLATIRQFGGAFVLGYQVYSQLEDLYGDKGAQTISGTLNNRVVFNTPDFRTAKLWSESLGESDVIEAQESLTLGAAQARDAVGVLGRRTQKAIVTPAEIQSLPQLTAYFRQAYDAPTARVSFDPLPSDNDVPKFVRYSGDGFDRGGMHLGEQNRAVEEGVTPLRGFAALPPQEQLGEFNKWVDTHLGGDVRDDIGADPMQRDFYWNHFAAQRMRGRKSSEIRRPAMAIPMIGATTQPAETSCARLPFPDPATASKTSAPASKKPRSPHAAKKPMSALDIFDLAEGRGQ